MPLPLVITANAAVGKQWAGLAGEVLSGIAGGLICLAGAADLAGGGLLAPAPTADMQRALDVTVMATGVIAATVAWRPVRVRAARVLAIDADSPVHALALALAVILLGTDLAVLSFTDVLAGSNALPLTVADLFLGETPFLILAFAGVGLFIRRQAQGAAERLGLVRPRWWQPALAVAAAGVFFTFAVVMNEAGHRFTPGLANRVDTATQQVFGGLNNPLGIAGLALLPGICEDILFRGALQPRLGIVVTAILFTSLHTEYGLSFDTVSVLGIALALGVLRKYTNTTTSCTSHVIYNLLVSVGVPDAFLYGAVGVEAALLGVAGYGIWSQRRRAAVRP